MKFMRGIGFFITTQLMYLLISLVGWGLDDLTGFLSLKPRCGYALTILVLGVGVGVQSFETPEGIRGRSGKKEKLMPRQRIVRIVITGLLYVALALLPFADRREIGTHNLPMCLRWLGLCLFVIGIALVFWSGVALGKYYSADVTIQEKHKLVTSSVYRFIRHPRYLGAILMAFGLVLLFRSWVGWIGCAPLVGVLLFRIRDEEQLMHKEFGLEWEEYCRKSWRLIPFLY